MGANSFISRTSRTSFILLLFSFFLSGCSSEKDLKMNACSHPENFDANPSSIDDLVSYMNLLPKPLTIDCLLTSFERPIFITATNNPSSVQGAANSRSPRIFLKFRQMIMTVVPEGSQRNNIEISEIYDDQLGLSVKGDLFFPYETALDSHEPFKTVMEKGEMKCGGLCHGDTKVLETFKDGSLRYASSIIHPRKSSIVSKKQLDEWGQECISTSGIDSRCSLFKALYEDGGVEGFEFELPEGSS